MAHSPAPPTRGAGPTTAGERALGPDLTRGVMLLFIALANSHYFLQGDRIRGGFPLDGSWLDTAVTWVVATFVDGRAFPLFGLLFGYGVARIAARHADATPRAVRRILWRRSAVLVGVGFLHAVLLFVGDILAAYGVLLLLGAWAVRLPDRWLLGIATAFLLLTALPSDDSSVVSTLPPDSAILPPDVLTALTERPLVSLVIMSLGPVGFACPFLLGLWAGRRRIVEHPDEHRRLLRVLAVVGLGAAVLGAQPASLLLVGAVPTPGADTLALFGALHDTTGLLGGIGYAALLGLLSTHPRVAGSAVARVLAATGRRSMTCYLAQSVVWAIVFTPFLLDLSGTLTVATTALLATAIWAGTVALAAWLEHTGRRGPFETLVRRASYGRRPAVVA